MSLQIIQGSNGKPAGVFIPMNDWEIMKSEYQNLQAWEEPEPTKAEILAGNISLSTTTGCGYAANVQNATIYVSPTILYKPTSITAPNGELCGSGGADVSTPATITVGSDTRTPSTYSWSTVKSGTINSSTSNPTIATTSTGQLRTARVTFNENETVKVQARANYGGCGSSQLTEITLGTTLTSKLLAPPIPTLADAGINCANSGNNYRLTPDLAVSPTVQNFQNYEWSTRIDPNDLNSNSLAKFNSGSTIKWITRNAQVDLQYLQAPSLYVCARALYLCGSSTYNCSPLVTPKNITPPLNIVRTSVNLYTSNRTHTFEITPNAANGAGTTYNYAVEAMSSGLFPQIINNGVLSTTLNDVALTTISVNLNNANGVRIRVKAKNSCGLSTQELVKEFPFNNSLVFDGVDDYAQVAHNSIMDIGAGNFTFESWIKTTAVTNANNTKATILSKFDNNPGQGSAGFVFGLNSDGKPFVEISGSTLTANNTTSLRDNTCHHIAVTRDIVTRTLAFYIDGNPAGTARWNNVDLNNTNPLRIGNWLFQSNAQIYPFQSVIDEVRMWKVKRSATEISSWYDKSLLGNENGLIAYWKLNEGFGQTINDFGINALNGFLGSTTTIDGNDPVRTPQYAMCSNIARKGNVFETIEENASTDATLYPNPANELINIRLPRNSEIISIKVLDMQGKQLLQLGAAYTIDAAQLSNGFYMVELQTTEKTSRHKLQIIK